MDYSKFDVEDFATDESFVRWVNHTDRETDSFWKTFIISHPELRQKIHNARILVINLKRAENSHQQPAQIESMWQNITKRIDQTIESPVTVKKKTHYYYYAIAACITLLLVLVGRYIFNVNTKDDLGFYQSQLVTTGYIESVNKTEKPIPIILTDGSTVHLQPAGRLKYKLNYEGDSTRDVYLLGEAFFDVARDPYKPFLVHSNEIVTEVLGTSFRVKANRDEKRVVVSVKTGKVSVYAVDEEKISKQNGVILLPNEEVTYERQQQMFDKKLVASPSIVSPFVSEDNFTFDNTHITDVFSKLEDAYGIDIIYNEELMENCYLTAPLGSEPLFEKLKVICQTIGATYEVIDTKIVISGSGC